MSTVKVTDASFEADVLNSAVPVVVDFWAEWCGPCKMIGPSLEEIAKEFDGKVRIAKVNVDENPGIAGKLGIRSIPTLMLYKDGKVASQKVGAAPKGELKKWIDAGKCNRVLHSEDGLRPRLSGPFSFRAQADVSTVQVAEVIFGEASSEATTASSSAASAVVGRSVAASSTNSSLSDRISTSRTG